MTQNFDKQNYGIYGITNTVTGKMYIGQTVTSFKSRWSGHRRALKNGNHKNPHLRSAAAKYGHKAFRIDALEVGPSGLTREQRVAWCNEREEFWIGDSYLSSDYYNCQSGGNNSIPGPETCRKISENHVGFTGKTHTDETKQLMSENNARYWKGKKRSKESIRKQFEARKGYTHSEETKRKQSESHTGKKKPKFVCSVCGQVVGGASNLKRWHENNCKHKEQ
jgi:group I intron endonuclease